MFSKPLFKQSIKANWISWLVVAIATCFMLTLILAVVGSDSVNNVMNSMGESFEKNAVECQIEETSMNYYYATCKAADAYDEDIMTGYVAAEVAKMMSESLSEYGFTEEKIKEIATDSIINFRAQIAAKFPDQPLDQINPDDMTVLITKLSKSVLDGFPDDVKDGIADMQTLDITQLLTGAVFYKIVGILLAVIYIIMVSNSLISGQVDSGSMAYVLSTPIKRRTVTFTQMLFLIISVLGICVMTTATGIISLAILGSDTISYLEMIQLNIGFFFTMFAFSGICFFTSAWFNRSKHSMAIGGGISMYFVVATILGLFGSSAMPIFIRMDAMNFFNFSSITYFFDTESILNGTTAFVWKFVVLAVIGIAGFIIGMIKFNKKDLPL